MCHRGGLLWRLECRARARARELHTWPSIISRVTQIACIMSSTKKGPEKGREQYVAMSGERSTKFRGREPV